MRPLTAYDPAAATVSTVATASFLKNNSFALALLVEAPCKVSLLELSM